MDNLDLPHHQLPFVSEFPQRHKGLNQPIHQDRTQRFSLEKAEATATLGIGKWQELHGRESPYPALSLAQWH